MQSAVINSSTCRWDITVQYEYSPDVSIGGASPARDLYAVGRSTTGLGWAVRGLLRLPSEVNPDAADDRHFQQRYRRIAHEANHQHTE